jgi:hypothetical protein
LKLTANGADLKAYLDSAGHYLDLASAVLGVTLFSAGLFLNWLSNKQA